MHSNVAFERCFLPLTGCHRLILNPRYSPGVAVKSRAQATCFESQTSRESVQLQTLFMLAENRKMHNVQARDVLQNFPCELGPPMCTAARPCAPPDSVPSCHQRFQASHVTREASLTQPPTLSLPARQEKLHRSTALRPGDGVPGCFRAF